MRILIISKDGDSLGIAYKMVLDGDTVDMYIEQKGFKRAGVGLVNRVDAWRPHVAKADLVICDMVGFGKHEMTIRRMGKPFLGCNKMADMAELDRDKGKELFQRMGINTPTTYSFNTPKEAKALVDIFPLLGYVIKPNGNIDTGKTYVVKTAKAYEWALNQLDADQSLIVQDFVEGVEVSTEGWYNGRDWIRPFNHTFEEKKFMPGGLGRNTGCMGNVVVSAKEDKLVKETVMKIKPFLDKIGYRGPVDINAIVTEADVFALEFTFRLGYDAIEALSSGLKESFSSMLFETALGIKKDMNIWRYNIAVRVSVPPWPMAKPEAGDAGLPIEGLDEGALKHVFLTDVMLVDDEYQYAASDGVVLKVTANADDLSHARKRVDRTLGNIAIQDMQYRQDIGDRVPGDMKKLTEWGYLDA